jgi:hypothetical protein
LAAVTALAVGGAVTAHAASERSPYVPLQPAYSGATPEGAGTSVTNGGGYNYMVSLIRSAVSNTREGRARDAAAEIAEAGRLLATTNHLKLAR